MTIMKADGPKAPERAGAEAKGALEGAEPEDAKKEILSADELPKDSEVKSEDTAKGSVPGLLTSSRDITITSDEKMAFLDSVVSNSRFELSYSLFGGKITLTVRSLTSEETQALAIWTIKQSTTSPSDQMAGRHRKYLLAAQVSRYNGVDMPPLEQPLFETLGDDGKTVKEPGWVQRSAFWDDRGAGVVSAIMGCLENFDLKYSTLCKKAEDANFWNPDTP